MSTPHDMGSVVCLGSVASTETTPHTLRVCGVERRSGMVNPLQGRSNEGKAPAGSFSLGFRKIATPHIAGYMLKI
ncbi:hypothetical protein LXL04_029475 [Taraxacum kok-saghyz]